MDFGNTFGASGGQQQAPGMAPPQVPVTNIHVPSHFSVTPFVHDENKKCMKRYYWMSVVVLFLLMATFLGGLYFIFRRPIAEAVANNV